MLRSGSAELLEDLKRLADQYIDNSAASEHDRELMHAEVKKWFGLQLASVDPEDASKIGSTVVHGIVRWDYRKRQYGR